LGKVVIDSEATRAHFHTLTRRGKCLEPQRSPHPIVLRLVICLTLCLLAAPALANDVADCSQTQDNALAIRGCTARIQTLRRLQTGLITGLIAGGYFGDRAIADALNKRGAAYDRQGDHTLAIADYNQAIALVPNESLYYFNRGAALGNLGDYQGAISDFNHSLSLRSDFAEAFSERALAFLRSGEKDRALTDAEHGVQLVPRSTITLTVRGEVYAALGRTEEAVVDYRAALAIDPTMSATADAIRRLGFQPQR
jgi:tetratricopeptide (TPR) repeat protein